MVDDTQGLDNTEKPTEDWKTDDEPATSTQKSYLKTLAEGIGVEVPEPQSKAEASELIDGLQDRARATVKDVEIPEGD